MRKLLYILPFLMAGLFCSCAEQKPAETLDQAPSESNDLSFIDHALKRSDELFRAGLLVNSDLNKIPRSINNDGTLHHRKPGDWTCGFYPGSMWYLYEATQDSFWLANARKWTENIESVKDKKTTHDVGFMVYCSFGNGYRLTGDTNYLSIINHTSGTLSERFNEKVGCTKSWNKYKFSEKWQFPVIIDNMMNLEMLYFSAKKTGNTKFADIASTHASTTLKNHFREDYSSYHVVDYDSMTGGVIQKNTHQGLYDSSSWARGQTWGLYGYTFCYRETKKPEYLEQAKNIAHYIMTSKYLPEDKIPLWDYMDQAPDAPRDASAAALTASALLELSEYVDADLAKTYLDFATSTLRTLASDAYLNTVGQNHNFILLHATGNYPHGTEIDKPLNYADYYFLEALLRLKKISNK